MKLNEFINHLAQAEELLFLEGNHKQIPQHFHITEVGVKSKSFLDCGGVSRREDKVYFQIWVANDIEHRLSPKKLLGIIEKFNFRQPDLELEVEVEYQLEQTLGSFGVSHQNGVFNLEPLHTDCLAKGLCLLPETAKIESPNVNFRVTETKCAPNSGCC